MLGNFVNEVKIANNAISKMARNAILSKAVLKVFDYCETNRYFQKRRTETKYASKNIIRNIIQIWTHS